jgi:Tol biopolymer transport system component
MYVARADGSGQPQQVTQSSADKTQVPWSVSPDGKRLAYFQYTLGDYRLWTAPVEEGPSGLRLGAPVQFLKSEASDMMPQFSPNGKWIAYRSNLSGSTQIYVRPASGQAGQWVVSTSAAATSPVWSRGGHDLLYRDAFGNQVMAVAYTANGDTFLAEKPRVWLARFDEPDFDLSQDGKRILAIAPVQSAASAAPQVEHEVVFLQNFFDELRRRVPGSR